jgi:hypothetical protein
MDLFKQSVKNKITLEIIYFGVIDQTALNWPGSCKAIKSLLSFKDIQNLAEQLVFTPIFCLFVLTYF